MSDLPVIHRQLDRCDICGCKTHKKDLVRTNVYWGDVESSNRLTYSSYDSSAWACNGTDKGVVSFGPRSDKAETSVDSDGNVTVVNGSQTWYKANGAATYRMTVPVDCSSAETITFSVMAGLHQSEQGTGSLEV